MCEFCLGGVPNNSNRDAIHPDFAGFFSDAAIQSAVAAARRRGGQASSEAADDDDGDADSDGT